MLSKRLALILMCVFLGVFHVKAQSLFATPVPTPDLPQPDSFIPETELRFFLLDALDKVNTLPQDPSFVGSTQIVPDETATQLFSYAKFLFSFGTARELLGVTFAPIGIALYTLLFLVVIGATVWFSVKIITIILRLTGYVARWIMRLLLRGG